MFKKNIQKVFFLNLFSKMSSRHVKCRFEKCTEFVLKSSKLQNVPLTVQKTHKFNSFSHYLTYRPTIFYTKYKELFEFISLLQILLANIYFVRGKRGFDKPGDIFQLEA